MWPANRIVKFQSPIENATQCVTNWDSQWADGLGGSRRCDGKDPFQAKEIFWSSWTRSTKVGWVIAFPRMSLNHAVSSIADIQRE